MTPAQQFDAAYIASKDPRIQALFIGTDNQPGSEMDPVLRLQTATALALQAGLIVDPDIDARGADAFLTMSNDQQLGFVRKYAIGEKPVFTTPPGISAPGIPPYDPTAGKILVSANIADYPPFAGPVAPVVDYVGLYAGNGLYNIKNGAELIFKAGDKHTEEPYAAKNISFTFLPAPAIGQYFWQQVSE